MCLLALTVTEVGWALCCSISVDSLVTSFNLALNWFRAPWHNWYVQEQLGVVFGIDHTYKFDSDGSAHLTIIMIAPDQSGHRIAFGPVASEDNATTQYDMRTIWCARARAAQFPSPCIEFL